MFLKSRFRQGYRENIKWYSLYHDIFDIYKFGNYKLVIRTDDDWEVKMEEGNWSQEMLM